MSSQQGILNPILQEYLAGTQNPSYAGWRDYARMTTGHTTFPEEALQGIYQSKMYGRGEMPQGTGSFSNLVQAEKDIAKAQFKPPMNIGAPTTGSQGGGYKQIEVPQAESTVRPADKLDPIKKYETDKAMGKRGIKPEIELSQKPVNPNKAVRVGGKGIATQSDIYNALRDVENANIKEDIQFVQKMGADKIRATVDGIAKGITNTPEAQAIIKAMNSPAGQTALKAAKIGGKGISTLVKAGMKFAGPIGWGLTGYDAIQLGLAGINFNKAKQQEKELEGQMAKFEELKSQGIDPKSAWQMANGLPVEDESVAALQEKLAKSNAKLAKEQALTDKAKASYEAALAQQQQPQQMVNTGGIVPPTTPTAQATGGGESEPSEPMAGVQPPKTTLDYTNLNGIGDYNLPIGQGVTGGAAGMEYDPLAEKFTQDILGNNGVISQEQIMQQLQDNMAKIREVQARDPRYQGEILTPSNPYNIDERQLRMAQNAGLVFQGVQDLSTLAGNLQQNAQQMYQQQLANQAGVPYEDYIAATMEARNNELANLAAERENVFKQQAMQATNMKDKIGYMQEALKARKDYEKALIESQIKGMFDLQKQGMSNLGSLQVAQTNVGGDLAVERLRQQDPTRLMGGAASLYEAMAYTPEMYRGQAMYNLPASVKQALGIQLLTPEELAQLFAGKPNQVMIPQQRPTFTQRWDEWVQNRRGQ